MAAPIRKDELYPGHQPKEIDWEAARLKAVADQAELRAKFVKAGMCAAIALVVLTLFQLRGTFFFALITRGFDQADLDTLSETSWAPKQVDFHGQPITPYRTGKVIVVRRQLTKGMLGPTPFGDEVITPAMIDHDFAKLPGGLRASSPSEVETVVVVRRSFKAFKKEKMSCEIWVYDLDLKSQVAHSILTGRTVGDDPDVAAYVVGLPAR